MEGGTHKFSPILVSSENPFSNRSQALLIILIWMYSNRSLYNAVLYCIHNTGSTVQTVFSNDSDHRF